MDAELPRFVRGGCYHATATSAADDNRFAFKARVEHLFDGSEERVHIDVEVPSHDIVSLGYSCIAAEE
jgi:hypothetical protein